MNDSQKSSQTISRGAEANKASVAPLFANAALILDNLERILHDKRLFFTPLDIKNGVAYFGPGGFEHPTLGVYAQWWSECCDLSLDKQGNPIWFISGSPLSGCHACSAFDRDGNTYKPELKGMFGKVAQSFIAVNKRYRDQKNCPDAYTLEEAISVLKNQ